MSRSRKLVTHVALKHEVIGGHLLQNMIPQKPYEYYPCKHFNGTLIDEKGMELCITNTCFKNHLFITREK